MTIYIRTSDRSTFKRCRRKWNWESALRKNLTGKGSTASPLWLGSGVHFALEDFHGYKNYETAQKALQAYADAYKRSPKHRKQLPDLWKEDLELGLGMMEYYENEWLETRDPLETYIVDGVPQVEVTFLIPIPHQSFFDTYGINEDVVYKGTLDRVAIDSDGSLWIVEYKTAAQIQTDHFDTDPQIGVYCWAVRAIYDRPLAGVVYQQHRKDVPYKPRILAKGRISSDKSQNTTRKWYRQALIDLYTSVDKAPSKNIECLNHLATLEDEDADKFIRRDKVFRNEYAAEVEGAKILLELEDMLNPDLPLYNNATRDCGWCSFQGACYSFDDGSDWESILIETTVQREEEYDSWRQHLLVAA